MSLPPRQLNEQQQSFLRQAAILRKNLNAWDGMLHSTRGEDWPSMLGRLNAAFNQAGILDKEIVDASEHFVYVPQKSTINPQDIAFFLSTRLVTAVSADDKNIGNLNEKKDEKEEDEGEIATNLYGEEEPAKRLRRFETLTMELASEFTSMRNGVTFPTAIGRR